MTAEAPTPHQTRQCIFDEAARHLLAQGRRAYDEADDECRYRAPDGCMCAIGVLIKDEHYTPELEGRSACSQQVLHTLAKSLGTPVNDGPTIRLLKCLQAIHDEQDPSRWSEELHALAMRFGLADTVTNIADDTND